VHGPAKVGFSSERSAMLSEGRWKSQRKTPPDPAVPATNLNDTLRSIDRSPQNHNREEFKDTE